MEREHGGGGESGRAGRHESRSGGQGIWFEGVQMRCSNTEGEKEGGG